MQALLNLRKKGKFLLIVINKFIMYQRLLILILSLLITHSTLAQIRNMATYGGNLLQRARCPYFYEISMPCSKREPGTGCGAKNGMNALHAIFGYSDKCIAVHPSDMCVALAAIGATVEVRGTNGSSRMIAFSDFHRLPGDQPEKDTNLIPGELITAISSEAFKNHSVYSFGAN